MFFFVRGPDVSVFGLCHVAVRPRRLLQLALQARQCFRRPVLGAAEWVFLGGALDVGVGGHGCWLVARRNWAPRGPWSP